MESPVFTTAPADTTLKFKPEPVAALDSGQWSWIGAISLSGEGAPVLRRRAPREVRLASGATLPFPAASQTTRSATASLPVDFNYDFKTDLVLAGEGGVRFFRQDSPSAFTDVTSETKLPAATTQPELPKSAGAQTSRQTAIWISFLEQVRIPATVLRNNGDGTFIEIQPFGNVTAIEDFAWADFDADGDPDAAVIDQQRALYVFSNERQGQFTERTVSNGDISVAAINVMDVDNDGVLIWS